MREAAEAEQGRWEEVQIPVQTAWAWSQSHQ